MSINLTDPIFHNEDAARADLESIRWPDGAMCPFCGSPDKVKPLGGKSMGPGWYHCGECREKFTVRTGTVFERSHVPLHKWRLAFQLMAASKKGISAHQLHRMIGVTYQTAWFMAHRIREAMSSPIPTGGLGGSDKVVEADETFVGGKAKNRAFAKQPPKKTAVLALLERDGEVRSYRIANVTAKELRPMIVQTASRKSHLMTDELRSYIKIGKEFAGHSAVDHSKDEYARMGGFVHTNTVENYFSILKRGIYGVYQHVSEAHLHRYLAEFDFRYSNRVGLGISDTKRAMRAIKGAEGKRLMYRQPCEAANH